MDFKVKQDSGEHHQAYSRLIIRLYLSSPDASWYDSRTKILFLEYLNLYRSVRLGNDQFQLLNDKLEVADAIFSHLLLDQKTDRENLCQKKAINSLHDVGGPLVVHSVLITITYSET